MSRSVMTVFVEFGLFHFVAGVPKEKMFADYNLYASCLWLLVLLTMLCWPALIQQVRQSSKAN